MELPVKVSIIMLAYNIDRYIETAIKSVLAQKTNYRIQLVISEDCSTDRTLEICTHYAERYSDRITLVRHEQNVGLQRNFMDAHQHCTGEYIAICDGDDYWINKHKLQRMTDFMDAHPDFSTCFHRVVNYYEEDQSKSLSNGHQAVVTNITHLAQSNYITNSSSLFRRAYFKELPEWFSQITSCDYAMHLLNAQYGNIYYFKTPMAVYRKHNKGIWSEAQVEKRQYAALHVRALLLDHFKSQEVVYHHLRHAYRNIAFYLIRYYRSVGADEGKITETFERIGQYYPEQTLEELRQQERDEAVRCHARSLRQRVFSLLSKVREVVSRWIPLPKI
ncbi:MAG: glycosyltransferase [Bacteroides sp.]